MLKSQRNPPLKKSSLGLFELLPDVFVPGTSKTATSVDQRQLHLRMSRKWKRVDILGSVTEMPIPSVRMVIEILACIMEEGRKVVRAEGQVRYKGHGTCHHELMLQMPAHQAHSIMDGEGFHEALPFQEELLAVNITAGRGAVTGVIFFSGVTTG